MEDILFHLIQKVTLAAPWQELPIIKSQTQFLIRVAITTCDKVISERVSASDEFNGTLTFSGVVKSKASFQ